MHFTIRFLPHLHLSSTCQLIGCNSMLLSSCWSPTSCQIKLSKGMMQYINQPHGMSHARHRQLYLQFVLTHSNCTACDTMYTPATADELTKLQCCLQFQQAAAAMSAGWCSCHAAHLISLLRGNSNAACCACWGCSAAGSARHDLLYALLPLSFEHAGPSAGGPSACTT